MYFTSGDDLLQLHYIELEPSAAGDKHMFALCDDTEDYSWFIAFIDIFNIAAHAVIGLSFAFGVSNQLMLDSLTHSRNETSQNFQGRSKAPAPLQASLPPME